MTEQMASRFLAARKTYIASQFSQLNPMQRSAVLATEGPLLLLAGAGSGKTTVLINRIANLIRFGRGSDSSEIPAELSEEEIEFLEGIGEDASEWDRQRADRLCAVEPPAPWNIIAITFTNKAANELKDRLSTLLGPEAQDIWAMTFHSACCRILRRDIEPMGYTRSFTIYDTADSERVMKGILKELDMDEKTFPPKYVLGAIPGTDAGKCGAFRRYPGAIHRKSLRKIPEAAEGKQCSGFRRYYLCDRSAASEQ